MSVIDSKLKKQFNQNSLSFGNHLKSLINSNDENDEETSDLSILDSDTSLSISFGN